MSVILMISLTCWLYQLMNTVAYTAIPLKNLNSDDNISNAHSEKYGMNVCLFNVSVYVQFCTVCKNAKYK